MTEYLKKEDDTLKIMKKANFSPVSKQVEEYKDYDLIADLLSNSETLIKGIILSEILGKPKAKR